MMSMVGDLFFVFGFAFTHRTVASFYLLICLDEETS